MTDDELDHILSTEDDLVPSRGFTGNVMAAVRQEGSAPPPIPFPWKRGLPGLALCLAALVVMCVTSIQPTAPERPPEVAVPFSWTPWLSNLWSNLARMLYATNVGGLGWILLALVLTFASVKLSLRLVGRRI